MATTDGLQIPDKFFGLPPALIEKFLYFCFPLVGIFIIFSSLDKHLSFFQRNKFRKTVVVFFCIKILIVIFFLGCFVYFVYKERI